VGQEVLHRELDGNIGLAVVRHEVEGFQKTDIVSSAEDFVLSVRMPRGGEQSIWTNRFYHFEHADPEVNFHQFFDAVLVDNQIQLSYMYGSGLLIESISTPLLGSSITNTSLFDLTRGRIIPNFDGITNAVFGRSTNGMMSLTAYGDDGQVLFWGYRNKEWIIDLSASNPKEAAQAFQSDYIHWNLRSNLWISGSRTMPLY